MNDKKLVIFGTRNFAELAHYYFERDSGYRVAGFAVDEAYLRDSSCRGLPVVTLQQLPRRFPPGDHDIFVAIGYGQINRQRAVKLAELSAMGYTAASFVSSKASVADDVEIGPNTMIMEQAIVHPGVEIGEDCIVFPGSIIALHTRLGAHCWIVCATLDEAVDLGAYSFAGLRSVVGPGVSLGESCIVGAGAVVLADAPAHTVFRSPKAEKRSTPERLRRTFGVNPPGR